MRNLIAMMLLAILGCSGAHTPSTSPAVAPLSDQLTNATAEKIDSFESQYRFLSNFYPAQVEFEGMTYPSVEHAYQSAKTLDPAIRKQIAAAPTAGEAKRLGRAQQVRPDW